MTDVEALSVSDDDKRGMDGDCAEEEEGLSPSSSLRMFVVVSTRFLSSVV